MECHETRNVKMFYYNSLPVRKYKPLIMKNIHAIYLPQGNVHLNFAQRQTLRNINLYMFTARTFEFSMAHRKVLSSSMPKDFDLSSYDSEGADLILQVPESLVDYRVLSSGAEGAPLLSGRL